jgi:hypothetical protein
MAAMNLARHISVLWRFRRVVVLGVVVGAVMAFLAAFHVPSLERRGVQEWTASSDIFVTQSGFPWGRVTLAGQPGAPFADASEEQNATPFADPARFSELAFLYSNLVLSDVVRNAIPGKPAPGMIRAEVVDATGGGHSFLPIIKLTTRGGAPESAVTLNRHTIEALTSYLEKQQREAGTPSNQRVEISLLNAPRDAVLVQGRSLTLSVFAFLLCMVAAIAVAHILENLRPRPEASANVESMFWPEAGPAAVAGVVPERRPRQNRRESAFDPPDLQRDVR